MPAKLDDEIKKLHTVVPVSLLEKIDEWRGRQPGVPNQSAAIRRLLEIALETEKKGAKRGR